MLGAPPAFILSQDRTLRSGPDSPALLEKSLSSLGAPPARDPALPLISDSTHQGTDGHRTSSCAFSVFLCISLVCLRRSHRSQYPVFKVRRGPCGRARNQYTPPGGRGRPLRRAPRNLHGRRGIGKGAPAPDSRLRDPLQDQTPAAGRRRPALPRAIPAVPSALGGLTSGFGMGPGVPPLPRSPACAGRSGSCKSLGARALRAAQRGAQDGSPARSLPGPSGPWGKKSSTD